MRQAEVDSGKQGDRLTTEERERLDELENRELRRANEILKAASAYFAQALDPTRPSAMSFIDEHRSRFGVEPICRTLEWNVSSYYARKTRPPSRRELEDARLLGEIRRVHKDNYEAYGARRVWKQLAREGIELGRCRVERLMHAHGIAAPSARGPGDR